MKRTMPAEIPTGSGPVINVSQLPQREAERMTVRSDGKAVHTLLLVDDEPLVLSAAEESLRQAGYDVELAGSREQALMRIRTGSYDVAILDQYLGMTSGIDLMQEMQGIDPSLQFLIITGRPDVSLAVRALKLGASDFVAKPFTQEDLRASVEDILRRREKKKKQSELMVMLERKVQSLSEERKADYLAVLESFSRTVENRDHGTYGHSKRVCEHSCRIAGHLGIPLEEVENIRAAALLHDIGKIGISDSILGKPGMLTSEEIVVVRSHPLRGAEILRPLKQLAPVVEMVLHHHERFDGSGYPRGVAGEDIPFGARIIAVADTYDAICSIRPYRPARTAERAIRVLIAESGKQFDPVVARAMIEVLSTQGRPAL